VLSDFVLDEADHALKNRKLIPVRTEPLDTKQIPLGFRQLQTVVLAHREEIFKAIEKFESASESSIRIQRAPFSDHQRPRSYLYISVTLLIGAACALLFGRLLNKSTQLKQDCSGDITFSCIKQGKIAGQLVTNVSSIECKRENIYRSDDPTLKWKDIWTTSVYSYVPGGQPGEGPGGGLHNELLKVGGWGDLYHSLIQFETPRGANGTIQFAGLLLFAKHSGGQPVQFYLDRVLKPWGWKEGDRLWWKDKPEVTPPIWKPATRAGTRKVVYYRHNRTLSMVDLGDVSQLRDTA